MTIENAFLAALSLHDHAIFARVLQPVEISSGTDLYLPDDPVDWVYFPSRGLVSLITVMEDGDQAETAIIGREGAVGLVEAAGSGIMLYRAVVQIDLRALRAPAADYLAALGASESLRRAVTRHLELTIAEGRQTLSCLAHHAPEQRLAWWLLECQDRTGDEHLALTQEFLAAMLGIQRTTVTRVAGKLRSEGLIAYSRGRIGILDRPGLERRCCECYRTIRLYRRRIEGAHRSDRVGPGKAVFM